MRLIDADKLREELEVNNLGYQYYMLDNAPTVEAIPIWWIEKRIEKLESEPLFFITDYEPVILEDLIADWEKENENR